MSFANMDKTSLTCLTGDRAVGAPDITNNWHTLSVIKVWLISQMFDRNEIFERFFN